MKKKTSFATVILNGIAAAIWTIRAIFEIGYGTFGDSGLFFVLNILCAVLWIISFFVELHKYRSNGNDKT